MKAASANLLSIIKGSKQFVIPIYQRTYSWHQTQCEPLFHDIIRISESQQALGDSQGHFVGSVVYFQESIHTVSDVPLLLVIDGQQRLTTITLLITALAEFISKHPYLKERKQGISRFTFQKLSLAVIFFFAHSDAKNREDA
ncbi:MAG: DUF262 domain-containing protein [Methylococcales bacterium]